MIFFCLTVTWYRRILCDYNYNNCNHNYNKITITMLIFRIIINSIIIDFIICDFSYSESITNIQNIYLFKF